MKALCLEGKVVALADRPPPEPGPRIALIRMRFAGVCATDLELVKGYMGFSGTLGHEVVGTVVEGPPSWKGRRVTAEINFACGACETCARDLGRHCPTRRVMGILGADGAFAEIVAVPVANLHEVPEGVADEAAVFAEPLAAAFEILEQVPDVRGQRALVLGDGKLGQLAARVLASAGALVTLVGKHESKLALARACGIEAVELDSLHRELAPIVVEATGTTAGFGLATSLTMPRGTLVLKSTVADRAPLDLAPIVINEITVVGSRCGPFPRALAALADRAVDVTSLVSARYPLADAALALERAGAPGVLKVLVEG